MRLVGYADVFGPSHPLYKAYLAGQKKTPGRLLSEVLEESNGKYETSIALPDKFLREVAEKAAATGNASLAAAAETALFPISLEHLRGHDPKTTRIVYGARLERDESDPPLEPCDG
ncbi:MAG: hypothetical protein EKK42_26600 [Pseudonocardiaceae bacterium]|nr:MAG: hypothetical protein EKK42_26600 [Pseudonocardiaceae bacterium]